MAVQRTHRLNSLLQEVLADVLRKEVDNPRLSHFTSITKVEISPDLQQAKVYFSVLGTPEERKESFKALKSAAGFIRSRASQQVRMRQFPQLRFYIDDSLEKQLRIEELLQKIAREKENLPPSTNS